MSKKHEGTFADWLMSKGMNFPADTVIVKASESFENSFEKINRDSITRPPFKHSFWEGNYENRLTLGGFIKYLHSTETEHVYILVIFVKFIKTDKQYVSYVNWFLGYDSNGYLVNTDYKELHSMTEPLISPIVQDVEIDFEPLPNDHNGHIMFLARFLHALQDMNSKSTIIELVDDYPVHARNVIERKLGKEPSPYFMLHVHPDKPRKQYEGERKSNRPKQKSNMPETLVRGHVRIVSNHPIEHFNGVYWINAHTRGNKENGKIKKGYTIKLPKEKVSA